MNGIECLILPLQLEHLRNGFRSLECHFDRVAKKYGGSISAEHGVGLSKKPYLSYSRSETEIGLMKAIKMVFDPNRIMNPGKIFD